MLGISLGHRDIANSSRLHELAQFIQVELPILRFIQKVKQNRSQHHSDPSTKIAHSEPKFVLSDSLSTAEIHPRHQITLVPESNLQFLAHILRTILQLLYRRSDKIINLSQFVVLDFSCNLENPG